MGKLGAMNRQQMNSPILALLLMLLLLLLGAGGAVTGAMLGFCGMKGDGKSAAIKISILLTKALYIRVFTRLTCRLLLLRRRMSLQERMVEENIEWHTFLSVST